MIFFSIYALLMNISKTPCSAGNMGVLTRETTMNSWNPTCLCHSKRGETALSYPMLGRGSIPDYSASNLAAFLVAEEAAETCPRWWVLGPEVGDRMAFLEETDEATTCSAIISCHRQHIKPSVYLSPMREMRCNAWLPSQAGPDLTTAVI